MNTGDDFPRDLLIRFARPFLPFYRREIASIRSPQFQTITASATYIMSKANFYPRMLRDSFKIGRWCFALFPFAFCIGADLP